MTKDTIAALQKAGVQQIVIQLKGGAADKNGASIEVSLNDVKSIMDLHDIDAVDQCMNALANQIMLETER